MRLICFLFLVFFGVAVKPAQAVTITVLGADYVISTQTSSFLALQTTLDDQPWWGNQAAAEQAAADVGNGLGAAVNASFYGPFFAYTTSSDMINPLRMDVSAFATATGVLSFPEANVGSSWVFAIATPVAVDVPEINGAVLMQMLFVLGVVYLGLRARRRGALRLTGNPAS